MTPIRIAVIALSESFSEIWSSVGRFCGASVEVFETVGAAQATPANGGVIISAAGVENCALAVLEELRAAGAEESAVVGADADYRLVIQLLKGGASDYFSLPDDLALCRSWMVERVEKVLA